MINRGGHSPEKDGTESAAVVHANDAGSILRAAANVPRLRRLLRQGRLCWCFRRLSVVLAIVVLVDIMDVDSDAPVIGATNPRAYSRGVTAGTYHRRWRCLRDEDAVASGISRHRVRGARLRDRLDQQIGLPVDDAKHGSAARTVRPRIVAVIAPVEPHLVRAGNRRCCWRSESGFWVVAR